MSNEWREVKLGDIIEIVMGQSPKSEFYNITGEGLPFLQGNRTFGERYPSFDTYCTENKRIANKNDVIMSVRAPVGDLNIAQTEISLGRGVCAMTMKNKNNLYLYFLLKDNIKSLINRETGTVFGSVNKNDILSLDVKITDSIEEQKVIAKVLSSLDDKIELNNQINKTLEKIAQTIFKHWFVDFEFPNEDGEPYKSSGGEMVESELGMLPKGWEVKKIEDMPLVITDYVANGSFKNLKDNVNLYDEANYAVFIRNTDLKCNFQNGKRYVDRHSYNFLSKTQLFGGEVIISNVGDVGSVYLCPYLDTPMTLGNNIIMIKSEGQLDWNYYIYRFFKSHIGQKMLESITGGSVQSKFNKTDFRNLNIINPNYKVLNLFNYILEVIGEKNNYMVKENQTLTYIRDTLLPKLMTGKIRVPLCEVDNIS